MPDIVQEEQEVTRYTAFIGIDPGVHGGLAVITKDGVATAYNTTTEQQTWDLIRSVARAHADIEDCGDHTVMVTRVFACIEQVGGYIGDAHPGSRMFEFGRSYGSLRMALVAAGIPFETVRPQAWQKALGLRTRVEGEETGAWKNYLKGVAKERFPQVKVTKAVADALLIAGYARVKWGCNHATAD